MSEARCADAFYIRAHAVVRCALEPLHVGVHEGGSRRWYAGLPFDRKKAA